MYGTREASKCWGNEVTDTLMKGGCRQMVVMLMMFVNDESDYVTECHGDDFMMCADAAGLNALGKLLSEALGAKILPTR